MATDPMRVLILGGSGFVGRELSIHLARQGHSVRILSRSSREVENQFTAPCEILEWDGIDLPPAALEDCAVIVNLVGEGIADRAWTEKRRSQIIQSRTTSVKALARALKTTSKKPAVVIQATAVGYYGDRGDEELTEESGPGSGFLASTCTAWEQSLEQLEATDLRLVVLRLGMVLGLTGGALPKLAAIYSNRLGAALGSGKQWMSWIHIDDLVAMISAAIEDKNWQGTFNATAPAPCRNSDFNRALAKHGKYQTLPNAPAIAVRIAMGQRAELVLSSTRATPKRALKLNYAFKFKTIEDAIENLLSDSVASGLRRFVTKQWSPFDPARLWQFFSDPYNLEMLTPPWLSFAVTRLNSTPISKGTQIEYKLKLRGIPIRWASLISSWQPNQSFVDEQTRGPYAIWHHTHLFEPLQGGTLITDSVQYRLPVAPLGELVAGRIVADDIRRIFAYRRQKIGAIETVQSKKTNGDKPGNEKTRLSAITTVSVSPNKVTVLYDSLCPVCKREIKFLQMVGRGNGLRLIDIADPKFRPDDFGLTMEQCIGSLRGFDVDGRPIKGMDTIRAMYDAVGLGILMRWTKWPIAASLSDRAYEVFASFRPRFSGFKPSDCSADRCKKDDNPKKRSSEMLKESLILAAAMTSLAANAADFHSLSAKTARGKPYPFSQLKGKVVIIANTASQCGFTPQYKDLQGVQDSYASKGVVVLGMPSNSFKQEDLDSGKAAEFCEFNHGVKFTILEKAEVKGADAHPVFKYLTENASKTGDVKWNFEKFIIDGNGKVVERFPSSVAPSSPKFSEAIEKALAQK